MSLTYFSKNDLYCVSSGEQELILDENLTKCSCIFWSQYHLPCRHIFALRKKLERPIFKISLIPKRWQKSTSQDIKSSILKTKVHVKTDTKTPNILTVNQKYKKAIVVMKQISDHIANCGQSEFDFKLNKLKNLLSDWHCRQIYSENVSSCSPECPDGNIPSPTNSESTDTDVSEHIMSAGEELLEATSVISSESSNEEEFVDCDPVVDPNRSFGI